MILLKEGNTPSSNIKNINDEDGSFSTLGTNCGSSTSAGGGVVLIKNANSKGYLEAEEGDGVDISSRMQYHRGTVQKGKAQTLTRTGGVDIGVVVK